MKLEKILICFLSTSSLLSQEQRTIEILQAGKSIRNSVEYPDANILQKENDLRVILFHDGAKIESDISYYYFNENSFFSYKFQNNKQHLFFFIHMCILYYFMFTSHSIR